MSRLTGWVLLALSVVVLAGYQWFAAPKPEEPLIFTRVKPEPPENQVYGGGSIYMEYMDGPPPAVFLESNLSGVTIRNNTIHGTSMYGMEIHHNIFHDSGSPTHKGDLW
jgi:hypothetical protein